MTERRCISCWQVKDKNDLMKITADFTTKDVKVNPDSLTFGRSAYLCYNIKCVEKALKKGKLERHLKTSINDELKGQILNELRDN